MEYRPWTVLAHKVVGESAEYVTSISRQGGWETIKQQIDGRQVHKAGNE